MKLTLPLPDGRGSETGYECHGEHLQARVEYWAKRANDGELTPDENAEYEAFIDCADLITILKLKAQRLLEYS